MSSKLLTFYLLIADRSETTKSGATLQATVAQTPTAQVPHDDAPDMDDFSLLGIATEQLLNLSAAEKFRVLHKV